ncbi:polysaccharide biosynthesis C-terminal domain-containing protein [Bailinhaonella thermotolerans]|uniref:Uncharacterized protein n=1 Tax=Bailinhaonella thermotolerans TaxID=1070861 RepID=A0A3A4AMH0_9ACTN|nr:polysaccharide biosynthesis C-terminal domain-containing protein [Bailinhaonella thermotolerans]RJL30866.1 hypothetical protein D5H75_21425 [Bailinhaonella thermotolerans]
MTTRQAAEPETGAPGGGRLVGLLLGNAGARVGALGSLGLASVLVGRVGGAALVGVFFLIRMLPGVFTVISSGGQQSAIPYFLAGEEHPRDRVKSTLAMLTVLGSGFAGVLWLVLTPLWYFVWFRDEPGLGLAMALACAIPVATQLYVANTRALLQGMGDIKGGNGALFFEEFAFLPIYGLIVLTVAPAWGDPAAVGKHAAWLLVALVLADVVVAAGSAVRLRKVGYFSGWGPPDRALAVQVVKYGTRSEIGGLFHLLNSRLDALILGALGGTAILGVYQVAAKVAELLRVIGLTGPQVLYPVFAAEGRAAATRKTQRMMPLFLGAVVAAAVPLAAGALLIPWVFGPEFDAAIVPAWILIVGLLGDGVTGLLMGYFLGVGRPGLTSISLGVGLVVVAVLQVSLIGPFGVVGAAIATSIGYFVTTGMLIGWFVRVRASMLREGAPA